MNSQWKISPLKVFRNMSLEKHVQLTLVTILSSFYHMLSSFEDMSSRDCTACTSISCNTTVGIVTGEWAEKILGLISRWGKILFLSKILRLALRANQPPIQWVLESSFL